MARFSTPVSATEHQWSPTYRREDGQRVVLPPINPTTTSDFTSSGRRSSGAASSAGIGNQSASSNSGSGSAAFAFSNTFETTRPILSSSRMDSGDFSNAASTNTTSSTPGSPPSSSNSYRRSSRQATTPNSLENMSGSLVSSYGNASPYHHQQQPPDATLNMGWLSNPPPPSATVPSHSRIPPSRPSTSQSSSYPDFDPSNTFLGDLQSGHASYSSHQGPTTSHLQTQTAPQSPAFSFGPSPFPNPNANYLHPRSHMGAAPPLTALAHAMPGGSSGSPSSMLGSTLNGGSGSQQNGSGSRPGSSSRQDLEEEVKQLRIKVRELEIVNDWATDQLRMVGMDTSNKAFPPSASSSNSSHGGSMFSGGLGTHLPGGSGGGNMSPGFQSSWKARTDARIKKFCSLNRAGNALCAWHDSRRERRSFPPRMAPAGHLNCGCTYEQALFEESLARHGVGSYHPGEMVRMDPALRNPLLALLERRFGYKDGDFERDSTSGQWVEGEGAELWEAALSGGSGGGHASKSSRKGRSVDDGR